MAVRRNLSVRFAGRAGRSTLAGALACLIDPPTLIAIGLLLLNDHLLKAAVPSWWTGKLSDLAGLYFFPFLVLAALSLPGLLFRRSGPSPDRADRLMVLALALSGLWFTALKGTPASNAWAVALLEAITGRGSLFVVADPTDLIALAMLPLAWLRWKGLVGRQLQRPPGRPSRWKRWFSYLALSAASLSAVATSPALVPVSFGAVFDVAADPGDADALYASLATQRILKCERRKGIWGLLAGSCDVKEVDYKVETYRSEDGGRTWALYAEVGGHLWADPHTQGRLYVLNEEGLYLVEGGQARLLDVPFTELQVLFFPNGYTTVDVLLNKYPLALDPTLPGVLYLADGQRILASVDGGETWAAQPSGAFSAPVTALAVAPSASQTLYAATGSRVLRSDDGGHSWPRAVDVGKDAAIRALAIHPGTPEVVYAAGKGVWRSVNGGTTWQQIYIGRRLNTLFLHPADPDLIYVASRFTDFADGALYAEGNVGFSDDGGNTWHSLEGQPGWSVAVSPVAPHRMVLALGEQGVAIQDSLLMLPSPTPVPGSDAPMVVYADALAAGPGDPVAWYALAGNPPVLGRSEDFSVRWTVRPLADTVDDPPATLSIVPVSPTDPLGSTGTLVALGEQTAYHLAWGPDDIGVERFPVPGLDRSGFSTTGTIPERRPLLVSPSDPSLLFTTAPGGVLRSEDGGRTWTTHVLSLTDSVDLWMMPTATPMQTDAPTRPPSLRSSSRSAQSLLVVLSMAPSHSTTLYAAQRTTYDGRRGQAVFRSDDGGHTWQPRAWLTDSVRLRTLAVHPADPEIVYGGGNGLYRSGGGGTTWALLSPSLAIRSLTVVPTDPRLLYAVTDEGVSRSDDGGLTWTALCPSGLVNGPAEYTGVHLAGIEPDQVVLSARPTRPELYLSPATTCLDLSASRYDPLHGWEQFTRGLPVFDLKHE